MTQAEKTSEHEEKCCTCKCGDKECKCTCACCEECDCTCDTECCSPSGEKVGRRFSCC
jgi:hypothetical protein